MEESLEILAGVRALVAAPLFCLFLAVSLAGLVSWICTPSRVRRLRHR